MPEPNHYTETDVMLPESPLYRVFHNDLKSHEKMNRVFELGEQLIQSDHEIQFPRLVKSPSLFIPRTPCIPLVTGMGSLFTGLVPLST